MPLPLALIGAIPSLVQGGIGIAQMIKGRRQLNGLKRPEYQMPQEIAANLAIARARAADQSVPGDAMQYDRAGLAAANALAGAREGGGGLGSISAIQSGLSNANQNIALANQQQRQANQDRLMNMQEVVSKYRDQEWQMNKFAPYSDAVTEAKQRIGAGQQNMFGALNAFGNIATSFLGSKIPGGELPMGQLAANANNAAAQSAAQNQMLGNPGQSTGVPSPQYLDAVQMVMGKYQNWSQNRGGQYFNQPQ